MLRIFFIALISLVAVACDSRGASSDATARWTPTQLRAFELFRSSSPDDRLAGLTTVATAFPVAFDSSTLQALESAGLKISQAELFKLLGTPATRFSLAEHPEYFGAEGRPTNFDPRDLQILIYDVDCLKSASRGNRKLCSSLDVIMLKDMVLRVTVITDSRSDALKWLRPSAER